MRELIIDVETFSSVPLACGVHKYVKAIDFGILLFGYMWVDERIWYVVDFTAGERLPKDVAQGLLDPTVIKIAHNAMFERIVINAHFDINIPPSEWRCIMVKAAMLGLPLKLDLLSRVLKVTTKDKAGSALIRLFCIPCKPTKTNSGRIKNLPEHFPEKWEAFIQYCGIDVQAEYEIWEKIRWYIVPDKETELYNLDQKINDRGISVNKQLIENAIALDAHNFKEYKRRAIEITGLDNPNSVKQLVKWLSAELDDEILTLQKDQIPKLIENCDDLNVIEVLKIRQEMSRTSVKKYKKMLTFAGADDMMRGLIQIMGANRTGRFAGRGPQIQNFIKNFMKNLDLARNLVLAGDYEGIQMIFGSVSFVLSQLLRTAIVASKGRQLLTPDFKAIEARVLAWYAQEEWKLEVFRTHGKIYEATGSRMFKVPIEKITKQSELYAKSKISELALGFQGSTGALLKMGAEKMGLPLSELKSLVATWRKENKNIVRLWYKVQELAIETISDKQPRSYRGLTFSVVKGYFFIQLPSGRKLAYPKARLVEGQHRPEIVYAGMDQNTKQWIWDIPTYGGKLIENIIQATARDAMTEKMALLDKSGFNIVFHVHDEIVMDEKKNVKMDTVNKLMSLPISWAKGLPLGASGNAMPYYQKD